eukprot:TRINITY_DN1869_c0_g3_i8.p1 TRINITY_DN1869_c0_g3~~TRINITY_DN1869_c0_g3_i8.p1  ORF type:complete len:199 (+),score=34.13 TRINITY_DN1869_c0_g3_i8:127-723(+)
MEDRFSRVPGEILDIIFLNCDLKDTPSLSLVCKKFRSRIDTEKMWKERSVALWKKKIIDRPLSDLQWIKETVEILSWKKITKFLFNSKDGNYRYEWTKGYNSMEFNRYKGNDWIPSKSVHIDFVSGSKSIEYGEFLNGGSGHGVTHRSRGMYNGQLKHSSRHGQGKMIWLDGLEYEGEWSFDRPKNCEKYVHLSLIHI